MGCKQTKIIPAICINSSVSPPKPLSKEESDAIVAIKSATEEDPEEEKLQEAKFRVLEQLCDDRTIRKPQVRTGGVSFDVGLDNDHNGRLAIPKCPPRMTKRMERMKTEARFTKDEKQLIMNIVQEDELASNGTNATIPMAERQEKARQRREEKQRLVVEKFERKRKLAEERLKKLEEQKQERLELLANSILKK